MSVSWSANVGDNDSNNAKMGLLGYEILDSGRYTAIRYHDIQIPTEITSMNVFNIIEGK